MDIFVFIYLMVLIITVAAAIILWASEKPSNARIVILAVIVMMISILFGSVWYGAAAESAVNDCTAKITVVEIQVAECEIRPTILDDTSVSMIEFDYNEMKLSFYWTGTIKCWKTFVITINENNECVYAHYKD